MFLWYDYLTVVLVLSISSLIGVYFGYFTQTTKTAKAYLAGIKKANILPIAVSVTVGHFSAITFVGFTSDVYRYGAFNVIGSISVVLYVAAAIFIYYPALYKNNVTSTFEYLEKRFDHKTRLLGLFFYVIYENAYLPAVIYSPSIAVSVVTGANVQIISIIICGICVFYTAIGGLKTVIWSDLFQFIIIVIPMCFLCGIGLQLSGGFSQMWKTAKEGGRLDIFDFDLDPTKKDTFWVVLIGFTVNHLHQQCLVHSSVQKYLTLPTMKACSKALFIYGSLFIIVRVAANLLGLIFYAVYANCDPILNHQISKLDQLASFYVEQVAEIIPGISGLYMAALICAGISSLSSSLTALSSAIYSNVIADRLKKNSSEKTKVRILKLIVVVEGVICIALVVFVVPYLGDIIPMFFASTGIIDGPATGLMTLGIAFPKVDSNGAFFGSIFGFVFMTITFVLAKYYHYTNVLSYASKPLSTSGCEPSNFTISKEVIQNLNFTNLANNATHNDISDSSKPFYLFRISYYYYGVIGAVITIIVALLFDWVEKKLRKSQTQVIETHLEKVTHEDKEMQPFIDPLKCV